MTMTMKSLLPTTRPTLTSLLSQQPHILLQSRSYKSKILAARPIPPPTPFVPSVDAFLSIIGREMAQFSSKIPSWEALFRSSSEELKALGIEPTKKRRYLLWYRERFRQGFWGVGGEFKFVGDDGVAYVKSVEVPSGIDSAATAIRSAGMKKIVVNVPGPDVEYDVPADARQAREVRVTEMDGVGGPYLEPIKGGNMQWARIARKEGMWENKQGQKKNGGERRRKEVMMKKRLEERKKARTA